MKETSKLLLIYLFCITLAIIACTKIAMEPAPVIDLGVQSTSTGIKTIVQTGNTLDVEFTTTPGAKYSVQVVPFGKEEPVKKEGFTAVSEITKKSYDLSALPKRDYDFVFIDINGKEVKYPIVIK
jgi:hypothetical protein